MSTAAQRHWVEIGFVILEPHERTGHLPDDTKRVPYYCRLKGFVTEEPRVGEVVEVETLLGRRVSGEVLGLNPPFSHDFGEPVPELIEAGLQARAILDGLDTGATMPSSGGVEAGQ